MGYRIKVRKKNGNPMDKRQWLCIRDIDGSGNGYARTTESHATIFDTKDEIDSDSLQKYMAVTGCEYGIETV